MTDGSLPELRLSDAERDEVVSQLSLAMSEGRLDVSEFEQRSRQVYAAKVPSELSGVLEGLPVTASPAVRETQAADMPANSTRSKNRWFFSLIGDRTHRGALDMGEHGNSLTLLGDTTFDLTQVTQNVDLRIVSVLGDVTVLVGPGTTVDAGIIQVLGDREEDANRPASTGAMRVRLRIFALLGDVKIRVVAETS